MESNKNFDEHDEHNERDEEKRRAYEEWRKHREQARQWDLQRRERMMRSMVNELADRLFESIGEALDEAREEHERRRQRRKQKVSALEFIEAVDEYFRICKTKGKYTTEGAYILYEGKRIGVITYRDTQRHDPWTYAAGVISIYEITGLGVNQDRLPRDGHNS